MQNTAPLNILENICITKSSAYLHTYLFIYKNRVYKKVPRAESVSYVHNTFVPKMFRYGRYLAVYV